jgi:hypothetical protein
MRLDGMEHYLEGALRLLQFVEARRPTGRRFGPDADARWTSFRGDLATVDRVELMIRDADAEWPSGFGARIVYALPGVAEDEPFGSQWEGIDPIAAEEIWRRIKAEAAPTTAASTLKAIAAIWGLALSKLKLDPITATDHLLVVGPSAIAATIEAFASGSALDWSEQVVVVATPPAPRQLAAAASPILNASRPTKLYIASEAIAAVRPGTRLVVSADADPADRRAAESMVGF